MNLGFHGPFWGWDAEGTGVGFILEGIHLRVQIMGVPKMGDFSIFTGTGQFLGSFLREMGIRVKSTLPQGPGRATFSQNGPKRGILVEVAKMLNFGHFDAKMVKIWSFWWDNGRLNLAKIWSFSLEWS